MEISHPYKTEQLKLIYVKSGSLFKSGDEYYLLTNSASQTTAVNVRTGKIVCFNADTEVEVLNAKIIIE